VWQKKKFIVTKDMIAIGRPDDASETLLDAIPFVDVDSVREMVGMGEESLDKDSRHFQNAFMVTTIPGGQNSGRTYYFQTASADSYSQVTRHLLANSSEARKRAEFNTRFTKSQYKMRILFNSRSFQYFSALLIIMVTISESRV
jgi:hypothetical protein